jgi:hypothetical protein
MLKFTVKTSYTCSYMFQSIWTIFREPTLVLAKTTLFQILPLKCSVKRFSVPWFRLCVYPVLCSAHVSIVHCLSFSGSSCCSLLKSRSKIIHVSLLVMWQHILYFRMRCFSASPLSALKQRIRKYKICNHITNNDKFTMY